MSVRSSWRSGDRVLVRGERWTVLDETRFAQCAALRIAGAEPRNFGRVRTLLTPFDRPRSVPRRLSWRVMRPRRWLHAVRRAAFDAHPFGGLRAAAASQIDLLPYQLEPALALLRHGATRVLIADAVGLGKTIQAGLIVLELAARSEGLRALILTPAGLRDQWSRELEHHFGLPSTRADARWLTTAAREIPVDVSPWSLPGIFISSFDFAKQPEVLRPLEDVTWDLVIVDEVHGATAPTNRYAAVDAIASRARHVVLLTATPHAGDARQFQSICRIGARERDDRIVMFGRARVDGGAATRRRTAMLAVEPTEAERRMHRLLERYAGEICREADARGDGRVRLAAIVLRKRALSSAGSLGVSVRRRMDLLAGVAEPAQHQLVLPLVDEDPLPDSAPDFALAAPGLADATRERRWLSAIAQATRTAARSESKAAFLLRLLSRVREPAIIFTEYRDTLARLQSALARAGHHALVIHGGMLPGEREEAQRSFNSGGSLLLATDAAAEGLNLHVRCRIVIHYELPWSPARLQQRTGRVDRIGQHRRVHEILLVANDTSERIVLAPLLRRAARAGATTGSGRLLELLTESRVATAVVGGRRIEELIEASSQDAVHDDCTTYLDLRREGELEAERLQLLRTWSPSWHKPTGALDDDGLLGTAVRPRRIAGAPRVRATLLYKLSITAGDGNLIHTEVVAVAFNVCMQNLRATSSRLRDAAHEIAEAYDPAARQLLNARFDAPLERVVQAHRAAINAMRRREQVIARAVPAAAQQLVQPGLFDRRALREAAARRRAAGELYQHAAERLAALTALKRLAPSLELIGLVLRPLIPAPS